MQQKIVDNEEKANKKLFIMRKMHNLKCRLKGKGIVENGKNVYLVPTLIHV